MGIFRLPFTGRELMENGLLVIMENMPSVAILVFKIVE
jgi:hypothetical protein